MPKAALEIDTIWGDRKNEVGTIDVWLEDERDATYLGAFLGRQKALAGELEKQEFYELADYVRDRRLGPIGYLAGMEVREDIRGQGVGSAMVKEMLREMKEAAVRTVFLHRSASIESSDEQLYDFYSRLGFEDVDCCGGDVWPVMKIQLS
jgi:ribosomal protein S18 acetylase RimI-like enzyme